MSPIHRNVCLSLRWNWTSVSSPFFFLFNIWDIYRVERNPLNLLVANVAIFGSISIYISLPSMLRVFCLFMCFYGAHNCSFYPNRGWTEITGTGDRLSNLWEWWNCIFSELISRFILNKRRKKKLVLKLCNNNFELNRQCLVTMRDFIQIWSGPTNRCCIKSWLLCNKGSANPDC